MEITHNGITYVFSVRDHPGKFSQSKKKQVGACKDLDCSYGGQFASVTMGLKPGPSGDVPETSTDCVKRLLDRVGIDLKAAEIKEIASLL